MNKKASNCTKQKPKSVDLDSLKRKSVLGGVATMLNRIIGVTIQILSMVILARLLSPDDYGIIAMVAAVTTFAGLFRDFGLSTAAVQKERLSASEQSNLFWINIALGTLLTTILIIISPAVAWFYQSSDITLVTIALSFTFLISSAGTQSGVLLTREMRFELKAIASLGGATANLIVSVALALYGHGYWSLVWGQIASSIATTGLLFVVSPFRPSLPSRNTKLKEMLGFGVNVAAFDIINYFARNLDDVLIGRFCGAVTLGLYSRAYALLMTPIINIRNPIQAIAFPAMSKIKNQPDTYRAYYRRIVSLLAYSSMPLTAFLFVNSGVIIDIVLGPQWHRVSSIFSILAITAFIQSPYSLVGLVQLTLGKGKKYFQMGFTTTIFISIGFCIGIFWGAVGVAIAYAIVSYILFVPFTLWAFNETPLRLKDFFDAIWLPALGSLLCIGTVLLANSFDPYEYGSLTSLVVGSLIFFSVYMAVLFAFPSGRVQLSWIISTCQETWMGKKH